MDKAYSLEIIIKNDEKFIMLLDSSKLSKNTLVMKEIKKIKLKDPFYITSSNEAIYVNEDKRIIKRFDFDLENEIKIVLCEPNDNNCEISGLFYDKNSEELLVANTGSKSIHIFDSDLKNVSDISLKNVKSENFEPYDLIWLRNRMLVSSFSTSVILAINKTDGYEEIKNLCSNSQNLIKAIKIYQNKYILIGCKNENYIRIFDLNFKKLTKEFKVTEKSHVIEIGTDGKRIFALTNKNKLEIFKGLK